MKTKITSIIFIFLTFYAFSQSNPCGTVINDTFDESALPEEWVEYNTTDRVTVEDGQLKLDFTTSNPSVYRNFTPVTSNFSYAFEVQSTRNYVTCYVNLVSSTGEYIASVGLGLLGNKKIRYASSLNQGVPAGYTGNLITANYASNTKYSISLNANIENQTLDFYNNGVLMASDIPFLETTQDVAKIDIQLTYMYSNEGRFFFDNISVIGLEDDRLALVNSVSDCETLLSSSFAGDSYGQYPQEAIDAFQLAVDSANTVLSNCSATSTELESALSELEAAKVVFEATRVNDPVLKIYSEYDFSGTEHEIYCGYYNGGLEEYNDWAVSFTLEQGYMVTFAQDVNGLGVSKVYIAQDHDLAINLPEELQKTISFIRVSPWYPVGKKGSLGDVNWATSDNYNTTWHYNWDLSSSERIPEVQFVPMAWSTADRWTSLENMEAIGRDMSLNHLMAFNEPDNSDQSNLTVEEALESYEKLLASGLRLGAPGVENIQYSATNDSFNSGSWIQEFMDLCIIRGYRVDFIPAHDYIRRSPETFIERFKGLHDRYDLPIWVTEFNYGNPNIGSQDLSILEGLANIEGLVEVLEESDFIERYNWYYFFGSSTGIGGTTNGELNLIGHFYRNFYSPAPSYIQEIYEQGALSVSGSEKIDVVSLYPNPVTNQLLTINYTDSSLHKNTIVKILNLYGKEVLVKTNTPKQIDVSNLTNGVYLVQIISGENMLTKKIIINN
ncbi:glycosyl hydrolase [Polaribacter sargassicola]|uniref:glycosyl hydrolase n=1 Tax=Polaribacter sargassicola TaxID=2836891 RepID=UPI001F0121F7|nr:glycosyl hydrolase [Polaribacter sp. DS7-9]MCG1035810.1 T9SS type A sorting domain-containing protein [Polaribacter sp. DS7-9]